MLDGLPGVVAEGHRFDADDRLGLPDGTWLLVRPDGFVAARATAGTAPAVFAAALTELGIRGGAWDVSRSCKRGRWDGGQDGAMTDSTNTPVASLAMVTLDAPDAAVLGEFWSQVLGWPVAFSDENYVMLTGPSHALGIGTIPDHQRPSWPDDGRKQFHLDLAADDVEAAARRCVELGATRPDEQPGEGYVVLIDPAGHPFCVTNAKNWG